jgi:hypothetical protein
MFTQTSNVQTRISRWSGCLPSYFATCVFVGGVLLTFSTHPTELSEQNHTKRNSRHCFSIGSIPSHSRQPPQSETGVTFVTLVHIVICNYIAMPEIKKMPNNAVSSSSSSSSSKAPFQTTVTCYRNNADKILAKAVDVHSANRDQQILDVATIMCPFLDYDPDENQPESPTTTTTCVMTTASNNNNKKCTRDPNASVKLLLGGLSNELFIVQKFKQTVLIRIHPENCDLQGSGVMDMGVVDRQVENRLCAWLSHLNTSMAPIYFGRFQNGRVEEFYQNVTPLSCHEMADFAPQIAVCMADFHLLPVPLDILPRPTCGKYRASHVETIDKWFVSTLQPQQQPPLPSTPRSQQEAPERGPESSSSSDNNDDTDVDTDADTLLFVQGLKEEWKWLKTQLESTCHAETAATGTPLELKASQFIREIVLTHMDCQSLNILKDSCTSSTGNVVRLIDFEYSGWNPRAADIANTFCEYCDMNNVCADYENEYPSEEEQNVFLRAYVTRVQPSLAAELTVDGGWNVFLATLRAEVGRFTLLSHMGWTVWSVIKSKESILKDFDYMAYARHRMDGYKLFKPKFF